MLFASIRMIKSKIKKVCGESIYSRELTWAETLAFYDLQNTLKLSGISQAAYLIKETNLHLMYIKANSQPKGRLYESYTDIVSKEVIWLMGEEVNYIVEHLKDFSPLSVKFDEVKRLILIIRKRPLGYDTYRQLIALEEQLYAAELVEIPLEIDYSATIIHLK